MGLTRKLLGANFKLAETVFPKQNGADTLNIPLDTLRMRARVDAAGGNSLSELHLDIYGLDLSAMNTLSTLGYVATTAKKNTVIVQAATTDSPAPTTIFSGTIYDASVDLRHQPEAVLRVHAMAGYINALQPATPSSYPKPTPIATIIQDLAGKMNFRFETNGVTTMLPPSYFYGSYLDQAKQAIEAARLAWIIDGDVLAVWLPGTSRNADAAAVPVSKDTGLEAYPEYNSLGIQFTTLFNPAIGFGTKVNVQSSQLLQNVPIIGKDGATVVKVDKLAASGVWAVNGLYHDLESLVPHGRWHSEVMCAPVGYVVAQ